VLTLVTGPVRSGKSRFAECLARARGARVTYAATARVDASDAEWRARIAHHAARRPSEWLVVETACGDDDALRRLVRTTPRDTVLLVDSLGTWLDVLIARQWAALRVASVGDVDCGDVSPDVEALERDAEALGDALVTCAGHAIVVGEEVGWGIVPAYPSARAFRDVLGRLQQRLATVADAAYLVVAGHAIDLNVVGRPVDAPVAM